LKVQPLDCYQNERRQGESRTRADHGAGVPEWTPEGVYDFCRSRSRTRSRIFEWKLDPELEQE